MTLFLHSMHGENPALHAGLEACPNSRHKSGIAEKQTTVITLQVNMYMYIHAIDTPLARSNLSPNKYNCYDGTCVHVGYNFYQL